MKPQQRFAGVQQREAGVRCHAWVKAGRFRFHLCAARDQRGRRRASLAPQRQWLPAALGRCGVVHGEQRRCVSLSAPPELGRGGVCVRAQTWGEAVRAGHSTGSGAAPLGALASGVCASDIEHGAVPEVPGSCRLCGCTACFRTLVALRRLLLRSTAGVVSRPLLVLQGRQRLSRHFPTHKSPGTIPRPARLHAAPFLLAALCYIRRDPSRTMERGRRQDGPFSLSARPSLQQPPGPRASARQRRKQRMCACVCMRVCVCVKRTDKGDGRNLSLAPSPPPPHPLPPLPTVACCAARDPHFADTGTGSASVASRAAPLRRSVGSLRSILLGLLPV